MIYLELVFKGKDVPSSKKLKSILLSVVTYNVLCQATMNRTLFLYSHLRGDKAFYFHWKQRLQLLEKEFIKLNADIYCLQEVEHQYFFCFYQPFFAASTFLIF